MWSRILVCAAVMAMLLAGGCGVKPESDVDRLRAHAEQGDARAQFDLGLRCLNGDGVTKSYVEAYKWFYLAETSGFVISNAACKTVAPKMTAAQITEAEARAKKWQEEFKQSHPAKK